MATVASDDPRRTLPLIEHEFDDEFEKDKCAHPVRFISGLVIEWCGQPRAAHVASSGAKEAAQRCEDCGKEMELETDPVIVRCTPCAMKISTLLGVRANEPERAPQYVVSKFPNCACKLVGEPHPATKTWREYCEVHRPKPEPERAPSAEPPWLTDAERWAEMVTEGVWDVPALETRSEFKAAMGIEHGRLVAAIREAARLEGVQSVMMVRCMQHFRIPQLNKAESGGGECSVCAVEEARREERAEIARLRRLLKRAVLDLRLAAGVVEIDRCRDNVHARAEALEAEVGAERGDSE